MWTGTGMTSCPEATSWGFWDLKKKKAELRFRLEECSRFLDQLEFTKCAARGGVGWKSKHRRELCLSVLMSKNFKLKKVNKSLVPEPILCISGFPMYISRIHISVVFFDVDMLITKGFTYAY